MRVQHCGRVGGNKILYISCWKELVLQEGPASYRISSSLTVRTIPAEICLSEVRKWGMPRQVGSQNLILLHSLLVKLIFTRVTCQNCWEMELLLSAMMLHLYHGTLFSIETLRVKL